MNVLKRWLDEIKEEQTTAKNVKAKPSFFEKTAKKAARKKAQKLKINKVYLWVFLNRTKLEISMRARKGENSFEAQIPYETMQKVESMMDSTSKHRAPSYLEHMVREHIGEGFVVSVSKYYGNPSMRVYWSNQQHNN